MTTDFSWPLAPDDTTPPAATGLPATMGDRLLMFVRSPKFLALVRALAERTEDYIAVAEEIIESLDVDTGTGHALDIIGSILQRPRLATEDDDRYRIMLQIQIELILSSKATTPVILRIIELFTGVAPTEYAEYYPMSFEVSAELPDAGETATLLAILKQTIAAAYGMTLLWHDDDALILDYTESDEVDDSGTLDYTEASTVTGSGTLGYEHVL